MKRTAPASEIDPTGAFERAYAEAAGVPVDAVPTTRKQENEMVKKMPKAVREARERVLLKVRGEDFRVMSQEQYSKWINNLPVPEFMALIDLHGEANRAAIEAEDAKEYVAPYTADDPAHSWVDCAGQAQPVDDDTVVWVTYCEGEIGGPNRAGAFIWDGEFIVSYAIAKNPKLRDDGDE